MHAAAIIAPKSSRPSRGDDGRTRRLISELAAFDGFGTRTQQSCLETDEGHKIPVFINEFWTAKQRAASSLHEVSYRACFKPQLPRFFIERLTVSGEKVHDPFMGRGTTPLEAALLGRVPCGSDANPLSRMLVSPRLNPPLIPTIEDRLRKIDFSHTEGTPETLLAFYHPETLRQICALKRHLTTKKAQGTLDSVDQWIWMVALNRLTGHSPGFFSVYTLPPNQAVSVEAQRRINRERNQTPPLRSVPDLILRKSRKLQAGLCDGDVQNLRLVESLSILLTASADETAEIQSNSVALVVTSPPFLDVVNYEKDNWLRAWFADVDLSDVSLWQIKNLTAWEHCMTRAMMEIHRVLKTGGWLAFEVGEVRNGSVKLESSVIKCGLEAGLSPVLILINQQEFTKTSNCWGISNLTKGTNTNRVVLFRKDSDF
jgi:hypothetical protein